MRNNNPNLNLSKIRTKKEKRYFRTSLTLAILSVIYSVNLLLTPYISANDSNSSENILWSTIVVSIIILVQVFSLFFQFINMAFIRMTALRLSDDQLPDLYKICNEISSSLGLNKTPNIYVINSNGILNAFAVKLARKRIVVLYSDLVDALTVEKDKKQVHAIIGHEIGHHALGHTNYWINYLISWAFIIPFLEPALSRAREYSADQAMYAVVKNKDVCSRALIKLAAGGKIGQSAEINAYTKQVDSEKGFFTWLAEISSSHPFLPKRILALV